MTRNTNTLKTTEIFGVSIIKTEDLAASQKAAEKKQKAMAAAAIVGGIGTVAGAVGVVLQTKKLQKVTDERDSAVLELGGKQPSYKDGKEAVAKAKTAAVKAIESANRLAPAGAAEGATDEAKKAWAEAKDQANRCTAIYSRRCRKFKEKIEELPKLSDGKSAKAADPEDANTDPEDTNKVDA